MSDKNEISEVSLETTSQNIPLKDEVTPLDEFKKWIKDHREYPQRMSKIFCF
jgi:hypothetical protein